MRWVNGQFFLCRPYGSTNARRAYHAQALALFYTIKCNALRCMFRRELTIRPQPFFVNRPGCADDGLPVIACAPFIFPYSSTKPIRKWNHDHHKYCNCFYKQNLPIPDIIVHLIYRPNRLLLKFNSRRRIHGHFI